MSADLGALPGLARDNDGPVFNEPWQARAFALAVRLYEQRLYSWSEWAEVLAAEIRTAQEAGDADLRETYWHHWTRALERLIADRRVVDAEEISKRADRWRRAYLATPHGQPVHLPAADREELA